MRKKKSPAASNVKAMLVFTLVAIIVLAIFWAIGVEHHSPTPTANPTNAVSIQATPAQGGTLSTLDSLKVVDNPKTNGKYDRVADFGPAWKDVDHNGCDTRNDILARDLTNISYRTDEAKKANKCVIVSGSLADPYSGTQIVFSKKNASKVQIDHVVALENAWRSGADKLTQDQREALANDPENLLAVNGSDNQAKGSKDASQWMPPNEAFACTYASRQVAVKAKYGLSVTSAEKKALADTLQKCGLTD